MQQSCEYAQTAGYVKAPLCDNVNEGQEVSEEYVQKKYVCQYWELTLSEIYVAIVERERLEIYCITEL